MIIAEDGNPLSVDDAIKKLKNCATAPRKEQGRAWFDVAMALYEEMLRMRGDLPMSDAVTLTDEELETAFGASRKRVASYSICSMTSKRSYASEQLAIMCSAKIGHNLRGYFCDSCRGWHVTKEQIR